MPMMDTTHNENNTRRNNPAPERVRLIRCQEAADMLAVSTRMLGKLVRGHRISSVKVGRSRRFRVTDVEDFIERNTARRAGWKDAR